VLASFSEDELEQLIDMLRRLLENARSVSAA
jgi:hypothetical protein